MEPLFIDGSRGRLFAIHHDSGCENGNAILYFPPFAEENNRSRHVAADFARRAAAQGISVLLLDPYGTGDSDGEFAEADWTTWLTDAELARKWLIERGTACVWPMGLRTGALLAAQLSDVGTDRLILWAPVTNGDRYLRQFLRLRVAGAVTQASAKEETVEELLAHLAAGETLEVAGYELPSALARALADLRLAQFAPAPETGVLWLETGAQASPELPPAAEKIAESWKAGDVDITGGRVAGPGFWQQIEPQPCPELTDRTLAWLREDEQGDG